MYSALNLPGHGFKRIRSGTSTCTFVLQLIFHSHQREPYRCFGFNRRRKPYGLIPFRNSIYVLSPGLSTQPISTTYWVSDVLQAQFFKMAMKEHTERSLWKAKPLPFENVTITSEFWKSRIDVVQKSALPAMYQQMKETGRWDCLKLQWKPGDPNKP